MFRSALAATETASSTRRKHWLYVPYDQLTDGLGPLSEAEPADVGIVLIESRAKAALRPYHRQKLALVLANQRHFALEQARRGVAVRYVGSSDDYGTTLARVAESLPGREGPLVCMRPAERELRVDLAPLVERGTLVYAPHAGWLTSRQQFLDGAGAEPPWRMDAFYRHVRRTTGVLMEKGKPVGGRFSFDGDNRQPWRGTPPAPEEPTFEPDAVTREVGALVEREFADHPGTLDLARLPATRADAQRLWAWAQETCLAHFGTYEDAMSATERGLFHTRISPLLNLHRLTPRQVLDDALDLDIPLNSKEGFVRQVLGWREFVRHVHESTDGFRSLDPSASPREPADPSHLGARQPLPAAWWGTVSGLHCLDNVVASVWDEGWSHHITRLMVLSNLATLLDVSPRELTDWFWVAYVDAFDWVVEPNVLAMGTFGTGDVMTTKPYVSGAAYIDRMSDYCGSCAFHPKKSCPITRLYWAFLARHADALADNGRMNRALWSLEKRSDEHKAEDARVFERVRDLLDRGERVTPASLAGDDA